jgi:hypothetical protein
MSTRVTAFYYIFCDHPTILFQTTTNKHVQAYPKLVRCTPQDSQGPVLVHFGEKISVCAVVHNIKWHTNEVRTWRAPEGCTIKAIFCIFLVCWGCVQLYIYNLIIKRNPWLWWLYNYNSGRNFIQKSIELFCTNILNLYLILGHNVYQYSGSSASTQFLHTMSAHTCTCFSHESCLLVSCVLQCVRVMSSSCVLLCVSTEHTEMTHSTHHSTSTHQHTPHTDTQQQTTAHSSLADPSASKSVGSKSRCVWPETQCSCVCNTWGTQTNLSPAHTACPQLQAQAMAGACM